MTNSNYTPGPWYTKHGHISSLRSSHGCTIANCNRSARGISDDEAEANAHLIAAAPEMLEALKVALKAIDKSGVSYQQISAVVRINMRQAISAAEGRS